MGQEAASGAGWVGREEEGVEDSPFVLEDPEGSSWPVASVSL